MFKVWSMYFVVNVNVYGTHAQRPSNVKPKSISVQSSIYSACIRLPRARGSYLPGRAAYNNHSHHENDSRTQTYARVLSSLIIPATPSAASFPATQGPRTTICHKLANHTSRLQLQKTTKLTSPLLPSSVVFHAPISLSKTSVLVNGGPKWEPPFSSSNTR